MSLLLIQINGKCKLPIKLYIYYSKHTEPVNQQNSCVWSKISYRIFYQTPTKYIYLESTHRDLQNGVKI
jgi:hypothetical protein